MSDSSELSPPAEFPSNTEIEQSLRRVVREALAKDEVITVNLARTRAESQLGLETGYLKTDGDWKQRSKSIISAAVEDPKSPAKPSRAAPKPKPKPATKLKRKSEDAPPAQKRQKNAPISESESGDDDASSGHEDESSMKAMVEQPELPRDRRGPKNQEAKPVPPAGEDSDLSDAPPDTRSPPLDTMEDKQDEEGESDLSSVIDDPPPKKRQRKSGPSGTKSKPKPAAKPTKTKGKESPDEEEIKRLQGWLLKCGIRKLWHRELAPHATSKDKIRHLKALLTDAGMTGRYSVEKARQIKERRELAAELQSAQEYNEKWGRSGSEDAEEGQASSRPRKGAPKGLVDFGDSGDSSG